MENLITYDNFDKLLESKLSSGSDNILEIRKKYEISESQWEAMRANPEDPKNFIKYKAHYTGKGAKDLVDKILDIVCFYIFGDDKKIKDFMMGVAEVESCYGTNPSTYKRGAFTKGIFQLDKRSSLKTIGYKGVSMEGNYKIKKRLNNCRAKINKSIGLDWSKVPYDSIAKPLYSALASRMYIESRLESYEYDSKTNKITVNQHPIGNTKKQQASWWKKRYNTASGGGTEESFINPPGCSL